MVVIRSLLVVLAALTLAAPVIAQERLPIISDVPVVGDFADPTSTRYGEWYFPIVPCVPGPIDNGLVRPECFGDPTEEDNTREETNAMDRVVRGGALFIGIVASGIEFVKDIVHSTQETFRAVTAIVSGFDLARPEQTAFRLANASDHFNNQIDYAEKTALQHQLPTPSRRYGRVQTVVVRALALAQDADRSAVTLSDQATAMQIRIDDDGEVKMIPIGGASTGNPGSLPPSPQDGPTNGGPAYRAPAALSAFQTSPALAARIERAGADDATEDPMDAVCALGDDMGEDPAVVFERVVVMAKGAQLAATPTVTTLSEERNAVSLIRLREKQEDYKRSVLAIFNSLFH